MITQTSSFFCFQDSAHDNTALACLDLKHPAVIVIASVESSAFDFTLKLLGCKCAWPTLPRRETNMYGLPFCVIISLSARPNSERVRVYRAQFVPQMVNSLTKLGMAQGGSNLENRSLAIDLCGVMVLWEERRIKELQAGPGQVPAILNSDFVCISMICVCMVCGQTHELCMLNVMPVQATS